MYRFITTLAVLAMPLCGQSVSMSFSFGGSGSVLQRLGFDQSLLRDTVQSIAVDNSGNIILAGTSFSSDFPQVHALTQVAQRCDPHCEFFRAPFVAKLDSAGSSLVYATLLGAPSLLGSSLLPTAVTVDADGNAYVTGTTLDPNFPAAKGATLTPLGGSDAFLIKLNTNGDVIYSTLFGSSADDAGNAISLGMNGAVYIVRSTVLPPGISLLDQELFLTTLDASTGRVVNSIDLGQGRSPQLALSAPGQVNVAATMGCLSCPPQVVVQQVDTASLKILPRTFTGAPDAVLIGLSAGADGSLYVALDGVHPTVTHLDRTGTPVATTTVTQLTQGLAKAFSVDVAGAFYLAGTAGPGVPQLHSSQPTPIISNCFILSPSGGNRGPTTCSNTGFITAIDPTTAVLNWSTYAGDFNSNILALSVDSKGNLYAAGQGIALAGPNAGKSVSVVKFTPQIPVIAISTDALTDAASFYAGLPNPKGLATVFLSGLSGIEGTLTAATVPLPTQLSGVTVRVNGVPAPLLAIANTGQGQQINFQAPSSEIVDGAIVQISQGANSVFLGGPRTPPGIFVLADGTPAIQHAADFSLVTGAQPVIPGETIIVYVTGLADKNAVPPDGTPFTEPRQVSEQVYVSIGQVRQEVLYAGGAPGLIGVDQINCKTSEQLASGLQTLTISSGNSLATGFQTVSRPVKLFVQ